MVAKYLLDLIDFKNRDQVNLERIYSKITTLIHLEQDWNLEKLSFFIHSEGGVVSCVVLRTNNQLKKITRHFKDDLAVVFVREVLAVGELIAPLLHADAGAVAEAGELLQGADRHEGRHGRQRVGAADIPVKLPRLGPGAHARN